MNTTPPPDRPRVPARRWRPVVGIVAVGLAMALAAAACGGSASSGDDTQGSAVIGSPLSEGTLPTFPAGTTLKVVTHDSFAVSDSVLKQFTDQTGVTVQLIPSGDAVTEVNKAILTKGNPEGDVLFGIDENLLTSAFDAGLFQPYEASGLTHRAGAVPGRPRAPGHSDRPRRRVHQLRPQVVHQPGPAHCRRRSPTSPSRR